jgi:hypothetical protein
MHAYRDAIRRSAGAYVLYPGTEEGRFAEFHELLPGLGAFALRPTQGGDAEGALPLRKFIFDVVDHVANQASQHERGRYWANRSYSKGSLIDAGTHAVSFLSRPPEDTPVLLGFVRGTEHWTWIQHQRRYNLRADERTGSVGLAGAELAAELVLLYDRALAHMELWKTSGRPILMTAADLIATRYPQPRGQIYLCLPLASLSSDSWPDAVDRVRVRNVLDARWRAEAFGSPVVCTWRDILVTE